MLPSQWQHLHSQPPGAERSPPEPRRELPRGVEPPPPRQPLDGLWAPSALGAWSRRCPMEQPESRAGAPQPPPARNDRVGSPLRSGTELRVPAGPPRGEDVAAPGAGTAATHPHPRSTDRVQAPGAPHCPPSPPGSRYRARPGCLRRRRPAPPPAPRGLPRPGPAPPPPRPGTAPLPRPGPAGPLPIAPERVPEPPGRGSLSGGCRNGTRWMEFKLLLLLFLNSFSSAPPARPAKRADIQDSREIKL